MDNKYLNALSISPWAKFKLKSNTIFLVDASHFSIPLKSLNGISPMTPVFKVIYG
jgi:hypothetical protein